MCAILFFSKTNLSQWKLPHKKTICHKYLFTPSRKVWQIFFFFFQNKMFKKEKYGSTFPFATHNCLAKNLALKNCINLNLGKIWVNFHDEKTYSIKKKNSCRFLPWLYSSDKKCSLTKPVKLFINSTMRWYYHGFICHSCDPPEVARKPQPWSAVFTFASICCG